MFFEKYQKYKNTQMIINSIRKENEVFRIGEINADNENTLSELLPNDKIENISADSSTEYDIVVFVNDTESLDSDEYISALKNVEKISKRIFISAGVFDSFEESSSDMMKNISHRIYINSDNPFFIKNIQKISPNLNKALENLECKVEIISHGTKEIRDIIHSMYMMSAESDNLHTYARLVNEHYNNVTFFNDYTPDGFMKIIVGKKEDIKTYRCFNDEPDISFYRAQQHIFSDMYCGYIVGKQKNDIFSAFEETNGKLLSELSEIKNKLKNPEKYIEVSLISDKNTTSKRYELKSDGFSIDIDTNGSKKAVIKPSKNMCVIELKKFKIKKDGEYTDIIPNSNASQVYESCYIFETDKPEFSAELDNVQSIAFSISYISENPSGIEFIRQMYENKAFMSQSIENLNKKIENIRYSENEQLSEKDENIGLLKNTVNELNTVINELKYSLSQSENELNEIKNSKSWKMTAPFRKQ